MLGLRDPRAGCPRAGSGVIVFVTNASRERATSGAVSASRQPGRVEQRDRHAAPARRTGPSTQSRTYDAVPLARRSRSRRRSRTPSAPPRRAGRPARAARPRRASAPGRRRARRPGRPGSASVTSVGSSDDLGVRHERGRLRVMRRPEAEQRRRPAEPLGEVGQRRDADPAADEERPGDGEVEAVAEGAGHPDRVTRPSAQSRASRGRSGRRGTRARPAAPGTG